MTCGFLYHDLGSLMCRCEGQAMADKPGENKPGEKVTHSDHGSVEKNASS